MTKLQWFLWGGAAFILTIHSFLMIFAVFVIGEIKNRLDKLEK
jgi:hypothetical protein